MTSDDEGSRYYSSGTSASLLRVLDRTCAFVSRNFLWIATLVWMSGFAMFVLIYLDDGYNPLLGGGPDDARGQLNWVRTQFYINYFEHGFVRRGLVGSIFYFIPESAYFPVIMAITIAGGLAMIGVFAWGFRRLRNSAAPEDRPFVDFLATLTALCPLGLPNLAYDVARYDLLCLLLLAFSIRLSLRGHVGAVFVVSLVGMLLHEAYIVYAMPLLAGLVYAERAGWPKVAISIQDILLRPGPALLGGALLAMAVAMALVLRRYGGIEDPYSVGAGSGQNVWDNAVFGAWRTANPQTYVMIALSFAVNVWLLARVYYASGSRAWPLCLAALSPVMLYALGNDYSRWISLGFFTAVFAVLAYAQARAGRLPHMTRPAHYAPLGICLLLPLGPIGVGPSFPYVYSALRFLDRFPWMP